MVDKAEEGEGGKGDRHGRTPQGAGNKEALCWAERGGPGPLSGCLSGFC